MRLKRKRKKWTKRLSAAVLPVVMLLAILGIGIPDIEAEAAMVFANPEIVAAPEMTAKQNVTWDCVWFGSYPQAEVISEEMSENYTAVYSAYFDAEKDVIVSDDIYSALEDAENESQWDSNDEITLDGVKYRRMVKADATYAYPGSDSAYYKWTDAVHYHYFKYEPVKWRVLSVKDGKALLLADIVLDGQLYYPKGGDPMVWSRSTIQSWLNGYNTINEDGIGSDDRDKNFIGSAFTAAEQSAIVSTKVVNTGNIRDNDTLDKIFLLSESEVYDTDTAGCYGFLKDCTAPDEARRCKSSTFAKAMGVASNASAQEYTGSCYWWLRSPGRTIADKDAACVYDDGSVGYDGYSTFVNYNGVRPALNLDLSASDQYYYAGMVSSDGAVVDASAIVDGLILKIGDVNLGSREAIETARMTYNALTEEQKGQVTGYEYLTAAEASLASLEKETTDVQAKIDALPAAVTLAHESAVIEARAAYDALTEEQKGRVNVANLTAAEAKLAELKQPGGSQSGSGSNSGSGNGSDSSGRTESVVKLNVSKIPLQVKQATTAVKVTTIGENDKIASWTSSNTKIATVTIKGKIKAVKVGKAKITVTTKNGATAVCTVTVQKAAVKTKSLKVSAGARLTLKKGSKAALTVTRNPITATDKITYKSSDKKTAIVTKKGIVKAKKKGSCKITVKSSNGKKKVVKVTVK